jgi:glycerol-3-phosphate acyltransferase PlsY
LTDIFRVIVVVLLAYLLGAFPTGYLIVRAFAGKDVRRLGSGRTGGTNVLRSAGPVAAALTVVGDALKGGVAVLLAHAIAGTPLAAALAGVAAVVGHNYSVFLSFDGGAGTMTNIGVALFLSPLVGGAAIVVGLAMLLLRRYASLASIVVAIALPLLFGAGALWFGVPAAYGLASTVSALIVINELRPNIVRLLAGTERKVPLQFGRTTPNTNKGAC